MVTFYAGIHLILLAENKHFIVFRETISPQFTRFSKDYSMNPNRDNVLDTLLSEVVNIFVFQI